MLGTPHLQTKQNICGVLVSDDKCREQMIKDQHKQVIENKLLINNIGTDFLSEQSKQCFVCIYLNI